MAGAAHVVASQGLASKAQPCKQSTALQTMLRSDNTQHLVFVEGTPQADLSHDCIEGTENVDDTSCGNDADAYGNNSSNNAHVMVPHERTHVFQN